ncbi:hypothetical protein REPUB_Repub04eG0164000 [Reevesia pubescens]
MYQVRDRELDHDCEFTRECYFENLNKALKEVQSNGGSLEFFDHNSVYSKEVDGEEALMKGRNAFVQEIDGQKEEDIQTINIDINNLYCEIGNDDGGCLNAPLSNDKKSNEEKAHAVVNIKVRGDNDSNSSILKGDRLDVDAILENLIVSDSVEEGSNTPHSDSIKCLVAKKASRMVGTFLSPEVSLEVDNLLQEDPKTIGHVKKVGHCYGLRPRKNKKAFKH